MDKIEKALNKLSDKERKLVQELLARLLKGEIFGLNIAKLKGHSDIFRLRKGDLRIIYRQTGKGIFLLAIERRSEKTYRDF
jgi:mRNA-degrading endonuclease RelE of RelBE toxin-antitoxin system